MASLRDIKMRITGVKSTAKITSAMKMVATAKLKRAQNAIISARPYVNKLDEILSNLVSTLEGDYSSPLLEKRSDIKNVALVVVSSDKGLCGSFNTNLFKTVVRFIDNELKDEFPDSKIHVIPAGKKAIQFFRKHEFEILREFPDIFSNLQFSVAKDIINTVKYDFVNGDYDRVLVYYNEFVNVLRQEPKLNRLLPVEAKIGGISENRKETNSDYIFEPDKKEILETLLPKLVDIKMWRILLESNAAEQASRRIAMENATTNAKELINELELKYNKARQASITTEMLEIVGGANALRQG